MLKDGVNDEGRTLRKPPCPGTLPKSRAMSLHPLPLAVVFTVTVAGCAAGLDGEALKGSGAPGQLVVAEVTAIDLPDQIAFGEEAQLRVRGRHSDSCTRFERFETTRSGRTIEVTAWAVRAFEQCVPEPHLFEASLTLAGLDPGVWNIVVNGRFDAVLSVADPALTEPGCLATEPLAVDAVRLPPPTWPQGSAQVEIEGTLPSPCHVLQPLAFELGSGLVSIRAESRACTPESCPPEPRPVRTAVDVGPLPEAGRWRVEVNGRDFGAIEVVGENACLFTPLSVTRIEVPEVAVGVVPVSYAGRLPSACAAVDPPTIRTGGDAGEVEIDLSVHECGGPCAADPVLVSGAIDLPDLPAGRYRVVLNGLTSDRTVQVLPAGACSLEEIPADGLTEVYAASGLEDAAAAGAALDIVVAGRYPAGCWWGAVARGTVGEGRIDLRVEATACEAECPGEGDFVVVWSSPSGLPEGRYTLLVNGRAFGEVALEAP
ncbi:MAG: hypothetical protein D6729_00585 [Deltaproteobacteria bacterium]|nr:MAG: hypothetical protein D6729_00585 [Deltaproteobacteria bacterium]